MLAAPVSNNSPGTYLPGQPTRDFRVPGHPLLKNPNRGCFEPTKETILNPSAWTDQALGVWGTATASYNDFHGQRRPSESVSVGKAFPIQARVTIPVRGEFFSRNESLPNPGTPPPATPPTYSNRLLTNGFGNTSPAPRAGQVVLRMRIEF